MARIPTTRLALIFLAATCTAQTQISLAPTTVPAAGQAGVTSVDLTGTGYPSGTILPADTDVKLTPAAGGTAVTTKPTTVTTIVGSTRRVTFLIPAAINVTSPSEYLVAISGNTMAGVQFASSNQAKLTINRGATIQLVNPNNGAAGQTVTVNINAMFTNFVQGSTQASFGAGISVGGAPEGALGPVTVTSDTRATAQLKINAAATAGLRDVTVHTGPQTVTLTGGFNVTSSGAGAISALTIMPTSIAFGVATSVTTTVTVTGAPDAGSVMLQRLDSSGRVLAVVGTLHDDGLNGDAKTGDGIFTLVSSFREFAVGPVSLRVSATFNNSVNHVFSSIGTLSVTGSPPPTVTITTPANLSYLNISPTTVTGTVSDPAATVVVNSIAAPVANGTFTASVPLAEGPNIVTATATSASGSTGTASITVTLDTTPPHVTITSPIDQLVTTASLISVAGNVNDTVVGTVNSQQAQVTVNGTAAQVANRTFLATNIPLNMGANTIRAVAVDRVGNSAATQITVVRQAPQPGQIQLTSGNNQSGPIGTALSAPLVVSLTESSGAPAVNKPVIFSVTQNNGMLSVGNGQPAATVMANTNAHGQATVTWKLGMRSGAGSDGVQAYSVGYSGTAVFTASANQGTPGMIVIDSGNNQTGAVNQALAKPFIAVVTDSGHNRLANVPVTFTVTQGGGNFSGQPSTTVNTDSDGRAAATLVLGFQEGLSNNLVTADFPANTFFPATFTASGVGPGDPAKTVISGLVLDNSNQPIPGVSVRAVLTNILNSNLGAVQSAAAVQSDDKGQFSITNAPVGFLKLFVDGSTATVPGVFPTLDYDMVTVAGQTNTVGQPIYLLPIKTTNQLCVTATTGGGTLSIPEAPGFSLTFGPGQVTFPGGSKTGCVSVTVVHPDKVPMVPGFGQQPRFIVTIQPSGALFNPPAPITLPNVDGLAPREVTEMYSFDHDIGSFVAIGTGTVSDDGLVIRSNQGVGVLKAGWHCGGNPNQPGTVATCPVCMFCQGNTCTPQGNGTPCGNGGTCQFTGQTTAPVCNCPNGGVVTTTTGACPGPCPPGTSVINGQCCQGGSCNPPPCPPGTVFDPTTMTCVNNSPCPPGFTLVNGQCCQGNSCVPPQCPPGLTFNAATGTCQVLMCGGQTCGSPNPCLDASCGANNQCVFSPNQFCQNACNGATSGSCSVNGVSGTCDSRGNCNLCGSLGAGATCTCGGGVTGTCNGSGQCSCTPPSVDLYVNGTPDTSDDITLLNPAQTIPITITMHNGSGRTSVLLTVSPSNMATLSQSTLTLSDGQTGTVTLSPLLRSNFPKDVSIMATVNGNQVGSGSLTIVDVTLPGHVTANDPLAQLPDRIPPNVATPVYIIVNPDLTSSNQSIGLVPIGNGANNGAFTISTTNVNATGFVQLTGSAQTSGNASSPGLYANQLQLGIQAHGQTALKSTGFSVAAWPSAITMATQGTCHPNLVAQCQGYYGILVDVGIQSDSPNGFDLGAISILEQIQVTSSSGVLAGDTPGVQTDYATVFNPGSVLTDAQAVSKTKLCSNLNGSLVSSQTFVFRDVRTGAGYGGPIGIPIPHSGFQITFNVFFDAAAGASIIDLSKNGLATTANGIPSSAGITVPSTGLTGAEAPSRADCQIP